MFGVQTSAGLGRLMRIDTVDSILMENPNLHIASLISLLTVIQIWMFCTSLSFVTILYAVTLDTYFLVIVKRTLGTENWMVLIVTYLLFAVMVLFLMVLTMLSVRLGFYTTTFLKSVSVNAKVLVVTVGSILRIVTAILGVP